MRKHFESGLVFFIVAAVCAVAGILQGRGDGQSSGVVMFTTAGVWFVIGIAVRSRSQKSDSQ